MKKGQVDKKMLRKLEERIKEKLEEPTRRVEVFESRNWIQFINQNVMSVVRFYSGPVKFTFGWLDGIDRTIRQPDATRDADEERHGDKPPLHEARRHGHGAQEQRGSVPAGIGPTPPPIQVGNHLQG